MSSIVEILIWPVLVISIAAFAISVVALSRTNKNNINYGENDHDDFEE
jgi:hypothetical protein